MKLTESEKQAILKLRQEADSQKPLREAFLKHDLWDHQDFDDCDIEINNPFEDQPGFPPMTWEQTRQIILQIEQGFEKILNKGDRFISYFDDGEELWYDDVGYGIEGVDQKWADIHLEGFKKLR